MLLPLPGAYVFVNIVPKVIVFMHEKNNNKWNNEQQRNEKKKTTQNIYAYIYIYTVEKLNKQLKTYNAIELIHSIQAHF